jgi:hypothetical protein
VGRNKVVEAKGKTRIESMQKGKKKERSGGERGEERSGGERKISA